MKLSETKLKQIISQEVRAHLAEYYIKKEIEILFEDSDDPELQKAREEYRRLSRQGKKIPAGLALALGLGVGGLKMATDQHSDTLAGKSAERTAQNIAAANTDEAQFEELVDQLNNQYAFRWGKGEDSVVHAPGSGGKITVLPPSYSVMVKVMQDKKMNAERIDQGLKPIQRYGEVDLDLGLDHDREYSGDYEKNIDSFFGIHQGDFVDAMNVVGSHDELQVVPGSGMEEQIIMVDPDKISGDYYLPELGMTASDYYNYQYGEYMGSGEKAALDAPEDEETFNPDTEINPELVQNTAKRAQHDVDDLRKKRMKEHKITWKNYKNRKKILA